MEKIKDYKKINQKNKHKDVVVVFDEMSGK